jgi:hypothetical protein
MRIFGIGGGAREPFLGWRPRKSSRVQPLRSQLSFGLQGFRKSGRRGSNPRHLAWEAMPGETTRDDRRRRTGLQSRTATGLASTRA